MNKKSENPYKLDRITPVQGHEVGVEVVVFLGKKRTPLTVAAARKLRDELNWVLR